MASVIFVAAEAERAASRATGAKSAALLESMAPILAVKAQLVHSPPIHFHGRGLGFHGPGLDFQRLRIARASAPEPFELPLRDFVAAHWWSGSGLTDAPPR